jgi:hypothetical protein
MEKKELSKSILSYNKGNVFSIHRISATLIDLDDIVIFELERINKQKLLCVALKTSTKIDSWFWLLPTETQIKTFAEYTSKMLDYYNRVNGKTQKKIYDYNDNKIDG